MDKKTVAHPVPNFFGLLGHRRKHTGEFNWLLSTSLSTRNCLLILSSNVCPVSKNKQSVTSHLCFLSDFIVHPVHFISCLVSVIVIKSICCSLHVIGRVQIGYYQPISETNLWSGNCLSSWSVLSLSIIGWLTSIAWICMWDMFTSHS